VFSEVFDEVAMSVSPLLAFHIAGGAIGVLSGFAAISVKKGSRWHAKIGNVFFMSMLGMSGAGVILAIEKSQPSNVFGGLLTFYLVATAWVTARRKDGGAGVPSLVAMLVALAVSVTIATFGFEALKSADGTKAGVPAGMYFFLATIAALAMVGDARVLLRGGVFGTRRIARHLWRMCFALFIASGSVFAARAHLFPAFMRKSGMLVGLTLAPLAILIFWLIRLRLRERKQKVPSFPISPRREYSAG
jgi:hypothetical protein